VLIMADKEGGLVVLNHSSGQSFAVPWHSHLPR